MQKLSPDDYAGLALPDQWIEDLMQERELAMLHERTKDCLTVLELGWGSGVLAKGLKALGREVEVVEGSAESCAKAREAGITAYHSLFENFQTGVQRDVVIASFVLEHVEDPVALLKKAHDWGNKLIVVAGNAASYHRQLAVTMGLQPQLDSLSERDKVVGHYRVYSHETLAKDLIRAGWFPKAHGGIMFKPLPNSMLVNLPQEVVQAMCAMKVDPMIAANILVECE